MRDGNIWPIFVYLGHFAQTHQNWQTVQLTHSQHNVMYTVARARGGVRPHWGYPRASRAAGWPQVVLSRLDPSRHHFDPSGHHFISKRCPGQRAKATVRVRDFNLEAVHFKVNFKVYINFKVFKVVHAGTRPGFQGPFQGDFYHLVHKSNSRTRAHTVHSPG